MGLPKPSITRPSSPGPTLNPRIVAARQHRVAELQAAGFFERHGEHASVAETDDLGADGLAAGGLDFAEIADGGAGAAGFDQQPDHVGHFAGPAKGLDAFEVLEIRG